MQAGKVLAEIAAKARKNAGMNGLDLDWGSVPASPVTPAMPSSALWRGGP